MPLSFEPALDRRRQLADILGAFPFPHSTMRRFLWLIVLSLGIAQQASAQQAPALPASAPEAAASAPSVASAPLADANDQPNEANRRITSYLTKKFGVAKNGPRSSPIS